MSFPRKRVTPTLRARGPTLIRPSATFPHQGGRPWNRELSVGTPSPSMGEGGAQRRMRVGPQPQQPQFNNHHSRLRKLSPSPPPPPYWLHFIRMDGTYDECVRVEQPGADGVSTRTVGPRARGAGASMLQFPRVTGACGRGKTGPRTCPSEVPASRDAWRLIISSQEAPCVSGPVCLTRWTQRWSGTDRRSAEAAIWHVR